MKKSTLKKYLAELSKALSDEESKGAIDILKNNLESYKEPKKEQKISEFRVPSEVSKNSTAYALYTDGACRGNPGPGSYGFLIQDFNSDIVHEDAKHFNHTTNNKMELSAVIFGLEYLADIITPMHSVYVYTDSKYVVDGMKSWVAGWKRRGWKKADNKAPENVELWKKLDELREICRVEFNWVKGHAGHAQNEYVDGLANKALDENGF